MGAVVEEPQGTATAGGVVDNLGHHGARLVKEQLVADTYLACRLYQHVPQAHLFIELAQQEHFYLGVGLLLGAVETGREYLGIIEYKGVALVEVVEYITEVEVLALDGITLVVFSVHVDGLRLAVQHHKTALIAAGDAASLLLALVVDKVVIYTMRIEGYLLLGQFELELR